MGGSLCGPLSGLCLIRIVIRSNYVNWVGRGDDGERAERIWREDGEGTGAGATRLSISLHLACPSAYHVL